MKLPERKLKGTTERRPECMPAGKTAKAPAEALQPAGRPRRGDGPREAPPTIPPLTDAEQAALRAACLDEDCAVPTSRQLDELFDPMLFRILAEPIRQDIVKLLAMHGPLDITSISAHFNQDRSVVSKHLKMMYEGGLLFKVKEARSTLYRVDGVAILHKLERVASDLREVLRVCCPETLDTLERHGMTMREAAERLPSLERNGGRT